MSKVHELEKQLEIAKAEEEQKIIDNQLSNMKLGGKAFASNMFRRETGAAFGEVYLIKEPIHEHGNYYYRVDSLILTARKNNAQISYNSDTRLRGNFLDSFFKEIPVTVFEELKSAVITSSTDLVDEFDKMLGVKEWISQSDYDNRKKAIDLMHTIPKIEVKDEWIIKRLTWRNHPLFVNGYLIYPQKSLEILQIMIERLQERINSSYYVAEYEHRDLREYTRIEKWLLSKMKKLS